MIAVGCIWLFGCAGDSPVSSSIGATVDRGVGTRLALAEHTAFRWDKVCIFGPYTSDDAVDSITGIPGASGRAYDIRLNEGINVLMFIDAGRIADSVAHPRGKGDFGPELVGKCYLRDDAIFSIRNPPAASWGNIGRFEKPASGEVR